MKTDLQNKHRFSQMQWWLIFLSSLGIGYALVKSFKAGAFEGCSIILICAGVAPVAGICRRAYDKKQ